MKPTIITLDWVPEFAHGYVKDIRVRWALEEAGIPYEVKLIKGLDQDTPAYRVVQPYGQVPAYIEGDIQIFESGAIVQFIGEKSEKLLSKNSAKRARAIAWMFSATNTLEPHVKYFDANKREPENVKMLTKRLNEIAQWLNAKEYLEDEFSVADIMMATVLRDLGDDEIIMNNKTLYDYRSRCEAREAFAKALKDQLELYSKKNEN